VTRLIVLNGPPGIGKSTIARRYLEDHPLTLCLEQDVVRGLLGGWPTRETESGTLARELCLCMARTHLLAGYDVVVPQFVAIPAYLDRLADLAREVKAEHDEFVLLDDVASAERRFHDRLGDPLWTDHQRLAAMFVAEAGGYPVQYDRLIRGLADRGVVEIRSAEGDAEGTYRELVNQLANRR
jgi:predicted kinase